MTHYTEEEAAAFVRRLEAQGARQSAEVRAAVAKDTTPARRAPQRGTQPAVGQADMTGSDLERLFVAALETHGADLPTPVAQYGWAEPLRHWRADFAWPPRVIVEVDGGQHAPGGGRHNTDEDRFKLNVCAALGWRVLRFSGAQLRTDPAGCIALVRRALER